jgi:hypothetical protein
MDREKQPRTATSEEEERRLQPFVSQLRASLITVISEEPHAARTYTTRHGTVSRAARARPQGRSTAV